MRPFLYFRFVTYTHIAVTFGYQVTILAYTPRE